MMNLVAEAIDTDEEVGKCLQLKMKGSHTILEAKHMLSAFTIGRTLILNPIGNMMNGI